MRKKIISSILLATVCAFGIVIPAQAAPTSVEIRCDFYDKGHCYDHWIPTSTSCQNIFNTSAPDWEKLACFQLFGPGRG